jgi:hypothetical protein
MIDYEDVSTFGRGNYIKVKQFIRIGPNHSLYYKLKDKLIPVEVGWIDKSKDGKYRYYEPETNELTPTFVEDSMEKVKEKIEAYIKSKPENK